MKYFLLYDTTGKIVAHHKSPDSWAPMQRPDLEAFDATDLNIPAQALVNNYKIEGGKLVFVANNWPHKPALPAPPKVAP